VNTQKKSLPIRKKAPKKGAAPIPTSGKLDDRLKVMLFKAIVGPIIRGCPSGDVLQINDEQVSIEGSYLGFEVVYLLNKNKGTLYRLESRKIRVPLFTSDSPRICLRFKQIVDALLVGGDVDAVAGEHLEPVVGGSLEEKDKDPAVRTELRKAYLVVSATSEGPCPFDKRGQVVSYVEVAPTQDALAAVQVVEGSIKDSIGDTMILSTEAIVPTRLCHTREEMEEAVHEMQQDLENTRAGMAGEEPQDVSNRGCLQIHGTSAIMENGTTVLGPTNVSLMNGAGVKEGPVRPTTR